MLLYRRNLINLYTKYQTLKIGYHDRGIAGYYEEQEEDAIQKKQAKIEPSRFNIFYIYKGTLRPNNNIPS